MKIEKDSQTKLTASILMQTRIRLTEMQSRLLSLGVDYNSCSAGKLIDVLVGDNHALDKLIQFFLSTDLSKKDI